MFVCSYTNTCVSVDSIVPDFNPPIVSFDKRYKIVKKIGEGAFGVVSLGELENGSKIAIKSFKKSDMQITFEVFQLYQREAILAGQLNNKFILNQLGILSLEYSLVQEFAKYGVLGM